MSRKSQVITSVATVLASLLVLAVTMPKGGDGMAHAGESGRPENVQGGRRATGPAAKPRAF